ncbi:PucR family transcriptional regulator [Leucobacter allii]|uniref:PucR family transcriptional regulator n=1 Tax=Leucobacter allii TaxID=2932247 RepID=A0ABY4FR86_9MICO|nr:PucR family transcriptional regulator [Leucobacter allii]UOQ58786.1 PucR family transcriptional regulator [Leucobacter allii]
MSDALSPQWHTGPDRAGTHADAPAPAPAPTISLGELLHQYALGLVLIAGADGDVAGRPVQWVHISELEDPAPFLTPRTVLLTTGARFSAAQEPEDAEAYVRRLLAAGTTALGVAVGLHWDRVPTAIVAACDRLGLPLFRVPYDTSFIAIVQTAARLLDARTRERDLWALESQRAVTNASLHRDGLGSAIREAARRLGRWVAVLDRSGRIVAVAPEAAGPAVRTDWVRREARRLVSRGVGAARISDTRGPGEHDADGVDGDDVADLAAGIQLQTLGRRGGVLGVLVAEDRGAPDTAERTLLGLVAALATVQLEHRSGIDAALASLRAAVVHLLLAGDRELAELIARDARLSVPEGPIVVVRHGEASPDDTRLDEDLHSLDAGRPGLIGATLDDGPLIVAEARHLPAIRRLLQAHRLAAGVSERGALTDLAELLAQSDRALAIAHARAEPAIVDYAPSQHEGLLRLLDAQPEAGRRAATLLGPLRHHDARHADRIEESLAVWLAHHGQTSAAAAELGIHRHTLRARVQTAESLLQLDLDAADARAELWAALRLAPPRA